MSTETKLHSEKWFDEVFDESTPANLRKASERLCRAYGIRGLADPMYIVNVIAVELGLGDGQGNFGEPETWARCGRETLAPDDLLVPCILPVNHAGFCDTGR